MLRRRLNIAIAAMVAILALSGWQCTTGEDTHPNAPQQPGPERGGPRNEPQGNPNPAAGDPAPHLNDLKQQIRLNPQLILYVVIWDRERAFAIHWQDGNGKETKEDQRAQTATSGFWTKVIPAQPGKTYGFLATPRDMLFLESAGKGTASCWIYHASATATGTVGDYQTVPQGPCAVSYTIPA